MMNGTTTTTITETEVQTNLRWDPSYVKTLPGILKLVIIVVNLLGFISVISTGAFHSTATGEWFTLVAMSGFWTSGTLLVFYLIHFIEKFHVIPWMMIEMGFCAFWAFFNFTSALDAALHASNVPGFGAAAFFGFGAMGIYGFDAWIKFKGFRGGQLAQGQQTVHQTSTSHTIPDPKY